MPVSVSRRVFLTLSGAAALASAVSLPTDAQATEYGFSLDGGLYETGFPDRASAVLAARRHAPEAAFQVAKVSYYGLTLPGEAGEAAVDHLINDHSLGGDLVNWIGCANEEADYEGDFLDACMRACRSDRASLEGPARLSLARALERAGADEAAGKVRDAKPPGEIDDAVLEAVSTDAVLSGEWIAHVEGWLSTHGLSTELRGLSVTDVVEHPRPVVLAA